MACLMLTGSFIFPLGDFSLARDLPEMYRNYSKITTPEELSLLDFIGDYLLHGKEMFGHNANDKPQSADNNVQFQHQPAPFYIILMPVQLHLRVITKELTIHHPAGITANTSDFKNKLFRPPLA